MPEQTPYPVFIDVEPTQVQNQNGLVGEAFSKHENHEAAGKWRHAMKELADPAGWELKATAHGDEKSLKFQRVQEAARKDIGRAFGVLQVFDVVLHFADVSALFKNATTSHLLSLR
nr:TMV resistance protein N-like [Tanacetum cinerariifolium]